MSKAQSIYTSKQLNKAMRSKKQAETAARRDEKALGYLGAINRDICYINISGMSMPMPTPRL